VYWQREQPFTHTNRQRSDHGGERANAVNRREIAAIQGSLQQLEQIRVQLVDGLAQRDPPSHGLKERSFDLGWRGSAVNEAAS
jgi:hypothetical protein